MRRYGPAAGLLAGGGLALALAGCGGGGVPSVLHGVIAHNYLNAESALSGTPADPGNCILSLPDQGSQVTFKADGVAVATAQLGKLHEHKYAGLGERCWESFSIPGVPGGKSSYSLTVNVNNNVGFSAGGCTGTVYYTPARLSTGKGLTLSC